MDGHDIETELTRFIGKAPGNHVSAEAALRPSLADMQLFDAPLVGVADAADPLFAAFKDPAVVSASYLLPADWLPGAKRVIGIFVPFTTRVRESNSMADGQPSDEWLHGRIDGQKFIFEIGRKVTEMVEKTGGHAVCPMLDERFHSVDREGTDPDDPKATYRSNWSERHTAYACGLGTFSLSKGLITEKGVCGRITSVVCDLDLPVTPRPYTEIDEYCAQCGGCVRHCPIDAISLDKGKDNFLCHRMLNKVKAAKAPYFGCGKCMCGVPCATKIPVRRG